MDVKQYVYLLTRVTSVARPVTLELLTSKLKEMYQIPLNIFYTQSNGEVRGHSGRTALREEQPLGLRVGRFIILRGLRLLRDWLSVWGP